MTLPPWLLVVRKVLGTLTDILDRGRAAGLYAQAKGAIVETLTKPRRFGGRR